MHSARSATTAITTTTTAMMIPVLDPPLSLAAGVSVWFGNVLVVLPNVPFALGGRMMDVLVFDIGVVEEFRTGKIDRFKEGFTVRLERGFKVTLMLGESVEFCGATMGVLLEGRGVNVGLAVVPAVGAGVAAGAKVLDTGVAVGVRTTCVAGRTGVAVGGTGVGVAVTGVGA